MMLPQTGLSKLQKGYLCSPGPIHSAVTESGHQGAGRQEQRKKEEDYRKSGFSELIEAFVSEAFAVKF